MSTQNTSDYFKYDLLLSKEDYFNRISIYSRPVGYSSRHLSDI